MRRKRGEERAKEGAEKKIVFVVRGRSPYFFSSFHFSLSLCVRERENKDDEDETLIGRCNKEKKESGMSEWQERRRRL